MLPISYVAVESREFDFRQFQDVMRDDGVAFGREETAIAVHSRGTLWVKFTLSKLSVTMRLQYKITLVELMPIFIIMFDTVTVRADLIKLIVN